MGEINHRCGVHLIEEKQLNLTFICTYFRDLTKPRTYKRKLGARSYKNYSDENVERALEKNCRPWVGHKKSSKIYKIPYDTLHNRYHGRRGGKNGGQSTFSTKEEKSLIKYISTCGEWGFLLTLLDVRQLAKNYLDSAGRTVEKFQNNLPGRDWHILFSADIKMKCPIN